LASQWSAFGKAWPKINSVEGWLVPGQEEWFFETTRRLPRTANIVEIGSFKGRSTVSIALACVHTNRRVFSIDTFSGNNSDFVNGQNQISWSGSSFFAEFTSNIERCGVRDYVIPLIGLSTDIAKVWNAPIHFLFVDGSHEYEDVIADFESFCHHVVSGGLIAIHDVTPEWEGPYDAWHQVIKHKLQNTGNITSLAFGTKP
jgi:predicted O-methyltransferase YrrM